MSNNTPVIIVIPARYASVRFPGKLLADLEGKPVIQWVYEKALEATTAELQKFVEKHIPTEVLGKTRAVHGTIYKRIIINADQMDCDLIVLGSHRPEKADYLLGPNAARVVRHANQSVFVVR